MHTAISNGSGHYCSRCGKSWDSDEQPPETCLQESDVGLGVEVGGNHYLGLAIQPVEFAMKNGWDFCLGSALKYLTRWRDKNGIEDLKKARHFILLREELLQYSPLVRQHDSFRILRMDTYIHVNVIRDDTALALLKLEAYWKGWSAAAPVIAIIDGLIASETSI